MRIRHLIRQLQKYEFVLARNTDDHCIYEYRDATDHHLIAEVTISGNDTANVPHFL